MTERTAAMLMGGQSEPLQPKEVSHASVMLLCIHSRLPLENANANAGESFFAQIERGAYCQK